jgi:hypothetical protein
VIAALVEPRAVVVEASLIRNNRTARSIRNLERRAVLRPRAAVIVDARSGDVRVADASDASRCRMVLPPSPRRASSSRQAMICARVMVRNSSGRPMPVKP